MYRGRVSVQTGPTINGTLPKVKIRGGTRTWTTCLAIEDVLGPNPSVARIQIGGNDFTVQGPITLNEYDFGFGMWDTVEVSIDGMEPIFKGFITNRMDTGDESVVFEAMDYRVLLDRIPVRGALVFDPYEEEVKYFPRFMPHCNPDGYWNCVGASFASGTWPVFAHVAEYGKNYQAPDETFDSALKPGVLAPWTPRRMLQYLWVLSHTERSGVQGTNHNEWRYITSNSIVWNKSTLNMVGIDAGAGIDPLDRKHPDLNYQGMTLGGAIQTVMEVAGTHKMGMRGDELRFYPHFVSGRRRDSQEDQVINMVRAGNLATSDTAYDFVAEEDASQVVQSFLVEGAPVRMETDVGHVFEEDDNISEKNEVRAELIPAWPTSHEAAFKEAMDGDGIYIKYPSSQGDPTNLDLLADGQGEGDNLRPLIYANTRQGIDFLRQIFPTVYKAWILDNNELDEQDLLEGYDNRYSSESKYPRLKGPDGRAVLPTQLQWFLEKLDEEGDEKNKLPTQWPVRVRVKRRTTEKDRWYDVPFNVGMRVDEKGRIWLDSLAEDSEGQLWCVYEYKLTDDASKVRLNSIRINLAYPLEHRVRGYIEASDSRAYISGDVDDLVGGPFLKYIDAGDSYTEDHQKNSFPCGMDKFIAGSGTEEVGNDGLSRLLPPGSEENQAEDHAKRGMARNEWVKKRSSFKLAGIRPDYKAGTWIPVMKRRGGRAGGDYPINAPAESVVYDFQNQTTIVGGLLSEIGPPSEGDGYDNRAARGSFEDVAGSPPNSGGRRTGRSISKGKQDSSKPAGDSSSRKPSSASTRRRNPPIPRGDDPGDEPMTNNARLL